MVRSRWKKDDGEVTWQNKSYRGELAFVATDTAMLIVNRVDVEEYLRSVVPLEIGGRLTSDHAAVEAQAVAARSFAYTKMTANTGRAFDLGTHRRPTRSTAGPRRKPSGVISRLLPRRAGC
jgi:stage II sporulation protein D